MPQVNNEVSNAITNFRNNHAKNNGHKSFEDQLAKEQVGIPVQENSSTSSKRGPRILRVIKEEEVKISESDSLYTPLEIDTNTPMPDISKSKHRISKRDFFDFDKLGISQGKVNGGSIFCLEETCGLQSATRYAKEWAKDQLERKLVSELPKFNFFQEKKKIGEEWKSGYRIYRIK